MVPEVVSCNLHGMEATGSLYLARETQGRGGVWNLSKLIKGPEWVQVRS